MMPLLQVLICVLSVLFHSAALSADAPKTQSEQEFCRLDRNSDRAISFEEFKNCEFYKLEHVRQLPFAEQKDLQPKNGSSLSDDELKDYLFKKADKNRDKRIDRKEWEEFYNSITEQPGGTVPRKPGDRR